MPDGRGSSGRHARRAAWALVWASAAASVVACSALTSFTGLVAGDDASSAPTRDAQVAGDDGSVVVEQDGSGVPVGEGGGGETADAFMASDTGTSSGTWGSLSVVQMVGSTGQATVQFSSATTAGNLLVAMQAGPTAPTGAGWVATHSSDTADSIFFWPNSPGGQKLFGITGGNGNFDVILIELAGAPKKLGVDSETDTGNKGGDVSSVDIVPPPPQASGALSLMWIDTNNSTSATAVTPGWSSVGTDGNNNFGWWRQSPKLASGGKVTVSVAPASASTLMVVTLLAK